MTPRRPKRSALPVTAMILMLFAATHLPALELTGVCRLYDDDIEVELRSRSGSPLLLELRISDPGRVVEQVTLDSESSSATFATDSRDTIELALTPFQQPGVYDLTLTLTSADGDCSREFTVGFTEFVWGRDNFRFSNARSRHGSARPYSEILFPWAEIRFGGLQPEQQTMLLHYAYRLFGGSIGRCYAFSGSQVRFLRNPELLPSHYDTIYAVREPHRGVQEDMNMLQNDIVFDRFITRRYATDRPQSREQLRSELDAIIETIAGGRVAAFGYLAPQRHHSMLAYGYIADPTSERLTLIAANNWGDEISQNLLSPAAESIAVNLDQDYDGARIRWVDTPIREYETAEHLFHVAVRDRYEHDPTALSELLAQQRRGLQENETTVVIVEEARDAALEDSEGNRSGRLGHRIYNDVDGVNYTRVDDVHLFAFSSRQSVTLHVSALEQRNDAHYVQQPNVFLLSHTGLNDGESARHAVYHQIEIADDEHFKLVIDSDGVQH